MEEPKKTSDQAKETGKKSLLGLTKHRLVLKPNLRCQESSAAIEPLSVAKLLYSDDSFPQPLLLDGMPGLSQGGHRMYALRLCFDFT